MPPSVGEKVIATLKGGQRVTGTVRWIGEHDFTSSTEGSPRARTWIGVELDEPVGRHAGRGFFSCREGHGVFLPPSKVVPKTPVSKTGGQSDRTTAARSLKTGETQYWDFRTRAVEARDLGHRCRECKAPFDEPGSEMVVRRGGRIELRYHRRCFSGHADPRTQASSSYGDSQWGKVISDTAPVDRFRKMRTSSHW